MTAPEDPDDGLSDEQPAPLTERQKARRRWRGLSSSPDLPVAPKRSQESVERIMNQFVDHALHPRQQPPAPVIELPVISSEPAGDAKQPERHARARPEVHTVLTERVRAKHTLRLAVIGVAACMAIGAGIAGIWFAGGPTAPPVKRAGTVPMPTAAKQPEQHSSVPSAIAEQPIVLPVATSEPVSAPVVAVPRAVSPFVAKNVQPEPKARDVVSAPVSTTGTHGTERPIARVSPDTTAATVEPTRATPGPVPSGKPTQHATHAKPEVLY